MKKYTISLLIIKYEYLIEKHNGLILNETLVNMNCIICWLNYSISDFKVLYKYIINQVTNSIKNSNK
jgi:hypothetical protein